MLSKSDKKRLLKMICIDAVALGAALLIFAFFHHVRRAYFVEIEPVALPQGQTASVEQAVSATEAPAEPTSTPDADTAEVVSSDAVEQTSAETTPEPTPEPTGLLKGKYSEKFSETLVSTDTEYRSQNVAVELTTVEQYNSVIHVLDIYIQDISSFRTYIPRNDGASKSKTQFPIEADEELGGVIAVTSGDQFYGHSIMGYIVRNGNLYSAEADPDCDALVMYNDGTMATFSADSYNPEAEVEKGIYQAWSFGPALLENGQAMSVFKSSVSGANPRLAIGYYEPGHYCLVEVDGDRNSDTKSKGVTLQQLSEFMASLGCTVAYNLDGGGTAGMVFNSQKLCSPGRRGTDLIYICEPEQ